MKAPRLLLPLCGVGIAFAAAAEPLGRLFFAPEQRLLLERQRQEGTSEAGESRIRLDGLAVRRSGRVATWVNGRVEHDERLTRTATLRVGESLDPLTGSKQDLIPDGGIVRSTPR
jgi:hypothetical protein